MLVLLKVLDAESVADGEKHCWRSPTVFPPSSLKRHSSSKREQSSKWRSVDPFLKAEINEKLFGLILTFAIAKTRQHEFYPIWGAEVRRKMQINCRIIAEQDWQKSAREPSRCILRSQSYVLLRSHFHAPPSTVPPHITVPCNTSTHSNVLLPSHFLGIFHLLATICITTPSPPTLWFPFLYFCFHICIFLASPRLFSWISPYCILFQLFFCFQFFLLSDTGKIFFYLFTHPTIPLLPLLWFPSSTIQLLSPSPFAPIKKHIISTVDDLKWETPVESEI